MFHGTGKRISEDERSSWHKVVHMFFQENVWVDTKVAVDWVKKTLKPATEHLKKFVLFADNLTGQVPNNFKESVSDCCGVVWYGLPNATDLWQPVDAGYAKMLKPLMEQEHYKLLDDEELADGMEMKNHIQQKKDVLSQHIGQVKHTQNYVEMNTMIFGKSCGLKQVV